MEKLQMEITLKDITAGKYVTLTLPQENSENIRGIETDHEYITADTDGTLPPEEYTSIQEYNDILLAAENPYSKEELMVLSKTYLLNEIREIVQDGGKQIFDFDAATADWNCGNGAPHSDEDMGRYLYQEGYNFLPAAIPEELEDYIRWEQNWFSAESAGARKVLMDNHLYIIL